MLLSRRINFEFDLFTDMLLFFKKVIDIVRHSLEDSDLVKNISQPEAERKVVVIKPIAHQHY